MNAPDNQTLDGGHALALIREHDHEQVVFRHDRATGLTAILAIHDTRLGPAAGGCRHWVYESQAAALDDALRLSRGMTLKNALADIPFGGGKSVILGVPGAVLSARQLETFGHWIDELGGRYITAEDVGMRVADMRIIARRTRFVSGLGRDGIGGDPSPATAAGVLLGIEVAVRHRLGTTDLQGLRVAVQGLGNVGYELCRLLHRAGARLAVADIDSDRVARAVREFGARDVDVREIHAQPVEVFSPCALGSVLTEQSVPELHARVVAGSANNQLCAPEVADQLAASGILYAPDFVINAGGVISVAAEHLGVRVTGGSGWVAERIAGIALRLERIFATAAAEGRSTDAVAEAAAFAVIDAASIDAASIGAVSVDATSGADPGPVPLPISAS